MLVLTAYRAQAAEAKLSGNTSIDAEIAPPPLIAAEGVDATSDLNASAEYRKHLAPVHTARAIRRLASSAA